MNGDDRLERAPAAPSPALDDTPMFPTTARLALGALLLALAAALWLRARDRTLSSEGQVAHVTIDGKPGCLGALIDPGWVLTAKHCVQEATANNHLAPERIRVSLGAQPSPAAMRVHSVFVRGPRYQSLGELMGRDLALLKLTEPSLIRPARWSHALPSSWGSTLFAVLASAPARQKRLDLRKAESGSLFVEGRTCPGDSGGPLYDEAGLLVGVASVRSRGECGTGVSVYTRVDVHRDWIHSTISEP